MRVSLLIFVFAFFSCSNKKGKVIDLDIPPPPPSLLPPSTPPSFEPPVDRLINLQVNPIPHPFNLNGTIPYAIWVNGEPLPMSYSLSQSIAKALSLEFKQPKNTAQIHNGEGWLYPLKIETD